jgi:glycerol-3-phosphate dehydrogenase
LLRLKKEGKSTKEVSRAIKLLCLKLQLLLLEANGLPIEKLPKILLIKQSLFVICLKENVKQKIYQFTEILKQVLIVKPSVYIRTDIPKILELQNQEPKLKQKLHPDYDYTMAEVVWAIRYEMARTIDDVLSRRVRLLF